MKKSEKFSQIVINSEKDLVNEFQNYIKILDDSI